MSRFIILIKIFVAAGAFACLFYFSGAEALVSVLEQADYSFVAIGSAIAFFGQYIAAQRWRGVLKVGAISITRYDAFRLNLIGTFFGTFLPGQGGGDLVKSTLLFNRFPERRAFLFTSVVYDRLLGLSAVLALALSGAVLLGFKNYDWGQVVSLLYLVVALAIIPLLLYRLKFFYDSIRHRLAVRFTKFFFDAEMLFTNSRLFVRSFCLSMIFQLSWCLTVWMMIFAVKDTVSLLPVLVAAPLSVLVATLPISLGGLGVREGVFSLILLQFDVSVDVATSGALLSMVPLLFASFVGAGLTLKGCFRSEHINSDIC